MATREDITDFGGISVKHTTINNAQGPYFGIGQPVDSCPLILKSHTNEEAEYDNDYLQMKLSYKNPGPCVLEFDTYIGGASQDPSLVSGHVLVRGILDPTDDYDAANKGYVDTHLQGAINIQLEVACNVNENINGYSNTVTGNLASYSEDGLTMQFDATGTIFTKNGINVNYLRTGTSGTPVTIVPGSGIGTASSRVIFTNTGDLQKLANSAQTVGNNVACGVWVFIGFDGNNTTMNFTRASDLDSPGELFKGELVTISDSDAVEVGISYLLNNQVTSISGDGTGIAQSWIPFYSTTTDEFSDPLFKVNNEVRLQMAGYSAADAGLPLIGKTVGTAAEFDQTLMGLNTRDFTLVGDAISVTANHSASSASINTGGTQVTDLKLGHTSNTDEVNITDASSESIILNNSAASSGDGIKSYAASHKFSKVASGTVPLVGLSNMTYNNLIVNGNVAIVSDILTKGNGEYGTGLAFDAQSSIAVPNTNASTFCIAPASDSTDSDKCNLAILNWPTSGGAAAGNALAMFNYTY